MPFTVFPVTRGSDGMPALGGKGPGASTAPVTMTVAAHGFRGELLEAQSDGSFSEVPDVSLGQHTNGQHQVPTDACSSN